MRITPEHNEPLVSWRGRILVVDDEHLLCWTLTELFESAGFRVTSCATVLQALRILIKERFDLVITDYRLPDANGFRVAEFAHFTNPAVAVMMYSAEEDVLPRSKEERRLISAWMEKPFDIDALAQKAFSCLRSESAQAQEAV